jgi:RNA recognition motif-containing protein
MHDSRQKGQPRSSLDGGHPERSKVMLYVGNLDPTVNDHELARAFVEAGKVLDSQIIRDRGTKRSRGFGFVQMAKREDAEEAIAKLTGRILKGRAIHVALALQRKLPQVTQSKPRRSKRSQKDLAKSQISLGPPRLPPLPKKVLEKLQQDFALERARAKAPKVPKKVLPRRKITAERNPYGWQSDVG